MKPVSIVTIKNFSPMYKDGEEASNIQIANVEEHAFDVVVAKDLYKVGDKAVFIQPDYCLSDLPLFESYTKPGGNPKKSRLGKNNRIRASKFGFVDSKGNKVYSNGILLPYKEVKDYLVSQGIIFLHQSIEDRKDFLDKDLDITKYEEPEQIVEGESRSNLPLGLYKTGETNINNKIKDLQVKLPCNLIGTLKIDASSISIFYKNAQDYGITSRTLFKSLTQQSYPGFSKFYDRDKEQLFWRNEETDELVVDIEQYFIDNDLQSEETVSDSIFVKMGIPILNKLIMYKKPLAIRGELYGKSLNIKNKRNPHADLDDGILVYGIDDFSTGTAIPLPMNQVIELCKELELDMVPIIFNKEFNTFDELNQECLDYFSENMVEGVVVRTFDNNSFSAKLMNLEYDSKK